MKFSLKTLLYIVIAAGAIFVGLTFFDNEPQADFTALEAMREGDMKKLNFSAPKAFVDTAFVGEDGQPMNFEAFKGQYTVVNFWATWCAPCIREMPTLDTLQKEMGDKGLHVIAMSQDREGEPIARPVMEKNDWANLDLYVAPDLAFARAAEVKGLPTTLIIDKQGREVARLQGKAEWDAEDIRSVLEDLIAGEG